MDEFEEKPDSYYNMRKDLYEKSRRLEEERVRKQSVNINDLKDRYLYKIHARNSEIGIWMEETGSFLISRFKLGSNFLFDEIHYDLSDDFGTVWPLEEIEEVTVEVPKPFKYAFKNDSDELNKKMEQILDYLNKKLREMDLLSEYDEQILKQENDE